MDQHGSDRKVRTRVEFEREAHPVAIALETLVDLLCLLRFASRLQLRNLFAARCKGQFELLLVLYAQIVETSQARMMGGGRR